MEWTTDNIQFLIGPREFSLLHKVKTGSGTHPDSYSMDIRGYFLEVKATRA
jgi:hypothetical protein